MMATTSMSIVPSFALASMMATTLFQNFKDNLKYIEERMKIQQGDAYDDEEPKAEIHGDQQGGDYKEEPEAETHGDQKADRPGDQQGGDYDEEPTAEIH